MKRISLRLLPVMMLAMLAFTACSSDDDDNNQGNNTEDNNVRADFVVTTHAGSGAGKNRSDIQQLEPDAIISSDVLAVSASSVSASTSSTVDTWLKRIGF